MRLLLRSRSCSASHRSPAPTAMSALTPIEIASGLVLGNSQRLEPAVEAPIPAPPWNGHCSAPLQRGPCLVSFSGGRDSSAVLAVATAVARREGLAAADPGHARGSRAQRTRRDASGRNASSPTSVCRTGSDSR